MPFLLKQNVVIPKVVKISKNMKILKISVIEMNRHFHHCIRRRFYFKNINL